MKANLIYTALLTIVSLTGTASYAKNSNDYEQLASHTYSIVYSTYEDKKRAIYLTDEAGKSRLKITGFTLSDGYPAISPDGKKLAFYGKYDDYKTWSIHVVNIDGSNMKRLTTKQNVWDSAPAWSPDGKTLMFAREFKDANETWHEQVWLMNPDGSNKRQIKAIKGRAAQFLQDGRVLFQSQSGPSNIFIANKDGSNQIQLTHDDTNNMSPKISPNGKQIAFLSNRDGNQEVYTMNIDGSNQQRMTFNEVPEWDPAWSNDGSKVFFVSANDHNYYDLFKINKDGSSLKKIRDSGSQVSTVKHLDENLLKNLIKKNL